MQHFENIWVWGGFSLHRQNKNLKERLLLHAKNTFNAHPKAFAISTSNLCQTF